MATDTNWVLNPCTSFEVADEGGAQASGTIMESIEEVRFSLASSSEYARAAEFDGVRVSGYESNRDVTVTAIGDEQALEHLALAFGGTTASTHVNVGAAGGSRVKTLYIKGLGAGEAAKQATVYRAFLEAGTEITLSRTSQQKHQLTFQALVDTSQDASGNVFVIDTSAADTTAPTISTYSPADEDTSVAVTANVVLTFSEAIRSSDITTSSVFLVDDSGNVIASSVSVTDTAQTQVTLNPTASLTASTTYTVYAIAGIRDTAGNKLAATESAWFTTAA